MLQPSRQGRRESRGGPGEKLHVWEGRKNFNYLCGHGQLINRVGPKRLHASKSLTVKALFYPSVHSLSPNKMLQ